MDRHSQDLEDWLAAAGAGSSEALGQALEACRNYLLLIARQELDPELQGKGSASDLVQETFLEAKRDFAQFHGRSEGELRAWLRRLLLNNAANFTRRYRDTDKRQVAREVALSPEDSSLHRANEPAADTATPSRQMVDLEEAQALWQALERLPEDYRQVLLWRYQDRRSFADIAERMQRSANAVRKLWARALERLQQEMEVPP